MESKYRKIIISAFILFVISLFAYSFMYFPYGYVGTTRKFDPPLGCVCHGDTATSKVSVIISGPDSVAIGTTAIFTVRTSHDSGIVGGFNAANFRDGGSDTLTLNPVLLDTMVRKQDGELTHTHPKFFSNDTVAWRFTYTASFVTGYDTLYATSNSANNDTTEHNDKWNWSLNKPVRIYNPIGIINISAIAKEFSLSQNYPNPFNPVTQIKFSVAKESYIELTIYDILGNKTETLVNRSMKIGEYKADFNASALSSGVYFYTLYSNGVKISTRKMLLVK